MTGIALQPTPLAIPVPPPDAATRAAILGDELPAGMVHEDLDLEAVAEATEGFSIRDVRHLAGRIAREALRSEKSAWTRLCTKR